MWRDLLSWLLLGAGLALAVAGAFESRWVWWGWGLLVLAVLLSVLPQRSTPGRR